VTLVQPKEGVNKAEEWDDKGDDEWWRLRQVEKKFLTKLLGIENEANELEKIVFPNKGIRGVTPSEDQMNPNNANSVPARMESMDANIKYLRSDIGRSLDLPFQKGEAPPRSPIQEFDKELLVRLQKMVDFHAALVEQVKRLQKSSWNPLWGRR
jgi:hypothetical protein